ncbi:MAG: hypothetical protein QS721_00355 [Candidatus Endonucleobacter sp. (ex Gigantidas childressi)]|nr:hypothetical protein [Candidatus Endonucleobacter sp. (ex Gigantidas childressi)]
MSKLIKVVGFLLGAICFVAFAHRQPEPEKFENIADQLKCSAYSAGEGEFNKLAYGVTDENIELITSWLKKNGTYLHSTDSAHEGETCAAFSALVLGGEMSYCALSFPDVRDQVIKRINDDCRYKDYEKCTEKVERPYDNLDEYYDNYDIIREPKENKEDLKISPELYGILSKIAENMSKHSDEKNLDLTIEFCHDDSASKWPLYWHRDWWADTPSNPDFIGFAVLHTTPPPEMFDRQYAKILLGLIPKEQEDLYYGSQGGIRDRSPSYETESSFVRYCGWGMGYTKVSAKSRVEPLIELNGFTGSGYIVDQSMVRKDNTMIVHSRQERKYSAVRLSMVVRCSIIKDAKHLMRRHLVCMRLKWAGNRNTCVAVPISGLPKN